MCSAAHAWQGNRACCGCSGHPRRCSHTAGPWIRGFLPQLRSVTLVVLQQCHDMAHWRLVSPHRPWLQVLDSSAVQMLWQVVSRAMQDTGRWPVLTTITPWLQVLANSDMQRCWQRPCPLTAMSL